MPMQLLEEFDGVVGDGTVQGILDRWNTLIKALGYQADNLTDELKAFHDLEKQVRTARTKSGISSIVTWATVSSTC